MKGSSGVKGSSEQASHVLVRTQDLLERPLDLQVALVHHPDHDKHHDVRAPHDVQDREDHARVADGLTASARPRGREVAEAWGADGGRRHVARDQRLLQAAVLLVRVRPGHDARVAKGAHTRCRVE